MPSLRKTEEGYTPIRGVKESDLLLLSLDDLSHQGHRIHDIKKVISPSWLKTTLMRPTCMLAYVSERAKKDSTFIEVKLDKSKAHFLKTYADNDSGFIKAMQVHIVESLASTIREYRTLRMSEFFGLSETILQPQRVLLKKQEQVGD